MFVALGFGATTLAHWMGGTDVLMPSTLPNIVYKILDLLGQVFLALTLVD